MADITVISKQVVSVKIDWSNDHVEILESFNLLEDVGVLRTNSDGTKELDVWYQSDIFKDKMRSKVMEFIKPSESFPFIRKGNNVSNRYNNLEMTMTDNIHVKVEMSNGVITSYILAKNNEEFIDDLTKEIMDLTDPQNPVSFNPQRYEKKVDTDSGWRPMFTLFKQFTNIVTLVAGDMMSR